jgi:hypothetical protein
MAFQINYQARWKASSQAVMWWGCQEGQDDAACGKCEARVRRGDGFLFKKAPTLGFSLAGKIFTLDDAILLCQRCAESVVMEPYSYILIPPNAGCWFCGSHYSVPTAAADPESRYDLSLFREAGPNDRATTTLGIPRCKSCRSRHDRFDRIVGASILVLSLTAAFMAWFLWATWWIVALAFVVPLFVFGLLLQSGLALGSRAWEHPIYRELRRDGWGTGSS